MDRETAIKLLESQHTFPSDHRFHVIVRTEQEDVDRVILRLAELSELPHLDGRVDSVPSRHGKYLSMRVTLPCPTAERVLEVYAHLSQMEWVIRYF